ncbi:MAG: DUF3617 family protein [Pseudolabrys sp.]
MPVVLVAGCLIGAQAAGAPELPQRKAGLWELKMSVQSRNLPPQAIRQCIDAKTDKMMNSNFGGGSVGQACATHEVTRSPGGFTVDSTCSYAGATTTSHAVLSGDFDSAYTVQVTSTRHGGPAIPGMAGNGTTRMTIAAKWLGPCRAGPRPGDVMMSNGMKMNVLDIRKGRGMHMHLPPR